ncbi:MAG: hypothetical protein LBM25_07145 [Bacteroidales bacterium]|jgi:hypothetical protein|nr:hypothetical protein [Bacteroidales bacterium]
MNFFYIREKLLHKIRRKNAHHIHSPFIFDLYNQIIKPQRNNPKKLKEGFENFFSEKGITYINCTYNEFIIEKEKNKDEEKIICIKEPYKSKENNKELKKILENSLSFVSIDLFYFVFIIKDKRLSAQKYIL